MDEKQFIVACKLIVGTRELRRRSENLENGSRGNVLCSGSYGGSGSDCAESDESTSLKVCTSRGRLRLTNYGYDIKKGK